jgi:hypothetical protein
VTIAGGQPVHCILSGGCETISPAFHPHLCLDVLGGTAYNGAPLWLSACIDGKDSQKWIDDDGTDIDNWHIKYAMDEKFCIDAPDTSDGTQLVLWECNGADSQSWDHNFLTNSFPLKGSSACWDFWEGWPAGQAMHLWQCNGFDNQQFDFHRFHTTPMPHPTSWHPGCLPDNHRSENGEACCSGCVYQNTHGHNIYWSACGDPVRCHTLPWPSLDSEMGNATDGQVQNFAEDVHVLV